VRDFLELFFGFFLGDFLFDVKLVDFSFHDGDFLLQKLTLVFELCVFEFFLMELRFELIDKLKLFGVIELRMCNVVELSLQLLDLLVFILDNQFIGILGFDMSFFLFHDMGGESVKLLFGNFDFLVDNLVGGLELFVVFLI